MVESLIFHIGDHKTGTTSLQRTLAQKGWSCDSKNLFYPSKFNHNPLTACLRKPEQFEFRQKRFSDLRKKMDKVKTGVGVISAEALESVAPAVLKETLQNYMPEYAAEARFIAYVRPHADRIVSSWAEQVKLGLFSGSLEEFHERFRAQGRLYYHGRFMEWRRVFGDRFTLRPMIRNQLYKDSVVQDFLHYALKTDDFSVQEVKSNESMSLEDMSLMTVLYKAYRTRHKHSKLQAKIGRTMNQILSGLPPRSSTTKPRMTKTLIPDVIATYQQDAKKLDTDFFDGTPMMDALQAAPKKAVDTSASITPEDYFTPDALRAVQALAQLITDLVDANKEGMQEHFHDQVAKKPVRANPKKKMHKGKGKGRGKTRKTGKPFDVNDLLDLI